MFELDQNQDDSAVYLLQYEGGHEELCYISSSDIIRPPSPALSVFELPVPAKPSPEVVDLLDNDVVEDPVEETTEELITLHTKYYPGNPLPKLAEVEPICRALIAEYKIKGVRSPALKDSTQLKTMVTNYLRHMVQNQNLMNRCISKLTEDSKSVHIDEAVWKKWSARTKLNNDIDDFIRCKKSDSGEFKTTMFDPKKHWKEILPLLIDGKTQLKSLLAPTFSQPLPTAAIMNTDLIWKTQWSPLNLTMAYELFEKTMPVKGIFCLKKWYIEYMNYVATSEQEFLMAVISCFGTNIKFYPGRVLSIFHSRNMLVESFQNVQVQEVDSDVTVVSVNQQNSIPTTTNRESQSQTTQGTRIYPGWTTNTPEGSQRTYANVRRPSQEQNQQTLPPGVHLISAADRARVEIVFGISCEQLEEILQRIYCDFTGTTAISEGFHLLTPWLQRNVSALMPQHLALLVQRTLKKLETENKRHFDSDKRTNQIRKLKRAEIDQWKKVINSEKMKRKEEAVRKNSALRSIPFTPQSIMESGTSLFQLSLVQTGTTASEIPSPNEWNPLNCVIPFELFKTLFNNKLQCAETLFCFLPKSASTKVSEDVIKVRYVEFMWKSFQKNVRQLLIGIFSAVGPDPDDLPLRILHILQLTGLWRHDLGLPLCYAVNSENEVFKPLDQNFRKRRLGNQNPVTPFPAKVAKPNAVAAKMAEPNPPSTQLSKSNPPPAAKVAKPIPPPAAKVTKQNPHRTKVTNPAPPPKKNVNLGPIGTRRTPEAPSTGQSHLQNGSSPLTAIATSAIVSTENRQAFK